MLQTVRVFWRTARFEILAGLGLSLTLAAGMLGVAFRLDDIRATACAGAKYCEERAWIDLQTSLTEPLMFGAVLLPLAVGLLFGPALVGRELERHSAPLAWSLVRSRTRWLLWRAAPTIVLVVVLLVGPALAAERLEAASHPEYDPGLSFLDVGARGGLVVVRGLLAFSLGLAAGVIWGRTLPAILLAGGLSIVGLALAGVVRPLWLPREELPRVILDPAYAENPLLFGEGYRLPDGRLLTISESTPLRPPEARIFESPGYNAWFRTSDWTRTLIGIPGNRLGDIVLREGLATAAAALAAFGVALVAVRRRRPVPGLAVDVEARRAVGAPAATRPPVERGRWRRTWLWLTTLMTTKVSRPEILGAIVASVLVIGATLIVIDLLGAARIEQGCTDTDCIGDGPFSRVNNPLFDWLYPLLAALPFVVGGLLGAPVIAREIESGTGRLTWSLTRSRVRWLVWRIAPLLLLLLVLLVPAAIAGGELLREQTLHDPSYFFSDGQIRGTPLVARGLAAFGIAVLAGVATRRVLPAIIVAGVAGLLVYNALDWMSVGGHWMKPDVLGTAEVSGSTLRPGSMLLTTALEAPDGSFPYAHEVALANGFPRLTEDGGLIEQDATFIAWYTEHGYREVTIGWDASRYPEVVLRESAVLLGGSFMSMAVAAGVLRNIRPG